MVTAPHHLASQAGLAVLRDGGNAIEAGVAMAATLAVVYPHMTGIGGDGFWLVAAPGREPIALDACGRAGAAATIEFYRARGLDSIPWRGALAANTVAGTVSGWAEALAVSAEWGGKMPLARLLEDAIWHGENGIAVTASQRQLTVEKLSELRAVPGFAEHFLPSGAPPTEGAPMKFPALARTLRALAAKGPDDFYRGELARSITADLAHLGCPVAAADLADQRAERKRPLSLRLKPGTAYNHPPPTQGLSSLMILGLFERLNVREAESFEHVHGLVEATKQAFLIRDAHVGDPAVMSRGANEFLEASVLEDLAGRIGPRALPWPQPASAGDTVWMGAIDGEGRAASFIQSVYFEFGSGVVLPETGIQWQNRGSSFRLAGRGPTLLAPGRKPFHTLNPALARFDDGRTMVYGTMGGEGQPQTQAAIFTRYAYFGQPLQRSVSAPRWLLGRTWGEASVTLKLESRFERALIDRLRAVGHDVEILPDFTPTMGHAGAIVRHADGTLEGASDPRSDGAVASF
jgi:gamma-glutamyltranspeptidase/glutathione hydrolase